MELRSKLLEIIVSGNLFELDNVEDILKETDDLTEVGLNSLSFIKLIVEIENGFGIEFEDEDLDHSRFMTLTSLCDYIEFKLQSNGTPGPASMLTGDGNG